jgi:hypothetical protein
MLPGLAPFIGVSGPPPTRTYLGNADTDTDSTSFSFSSRPLGTAAADRYILVGVCGLFVNAGTFSSLTVAGVSATKLVETTKDNHTAAFYLAAVPTGTTGTIAGTCSVTKSRYGIGFWAIYGLDSATPAGTGSAIASGNTQISNLVAVPGRPVFTYGADSKSGANTFTAPFTKRFSQVVGAASNHAGADGIATATLMSITQTYGTTANHVAVAVSF